MISIFYSSPPGAALPLVRRRPQPPCDLKNWDYWFRLKIICHDFTCIGFGSVWSSCEPPHWPCLRGPRQFQARWCPKILVKAQEGEKKEQTVSSFFLILRASALARASASREACIESKARAWFFLRNTAVAICSKEIWKKENWYPSSLKTTNSMWCLPPSVLQLFLLLLYPPIDLLPHLDSFNMILWWQKCCG